ncbi:MAG TPA: GntR family transcriptional regulator, partial [Capsulimonadaceae bacterium]|nr:GntR family transcriptional regulator [Capsulimonadaceae bacterium]
MRSALAVYKQIEKSLRHRINEGQWRAGTMLPSRRDLAKEYGVSSVTVERAIASLIAEGMLRADDRRGTFVALDSGMADSPGLM